MNSCCRFFVVFSFLFLLFVPLFCEEETTAEDPWVIGAQRFELLENRNYSKAIEAAASVIPQLVLEQISRDITRTIFREEQVSVKLDALLTERLALFLDLSKEVKARDSLILNNYTMIEYKSALRAQEKKIEEIQKKIDNNLKEQKDALFPDMTKKRVAKKMRKIWEPFSKPIGLYKNDAESLFAPSEESKKQGVESRAFAKEISSAKISGLIRGSMVVYGNYASVTAEFYTFPGAKKVGSVVEVGTLNDIRQITENIAFKLLPKIANGLPIELEFKVFPEDAIKTASLTIDNIVYSPFPEKVIVSSGIHSVSVDAEGYTRESFLYNFSDQEKFLIEVNFKEKTEGSVKLTLSKFVPGNMFFDGKFAGEASRTDFVNVPLKVNGKTVFGYFEGTVKDKDAPDGERTETMFMMIPAKLMADGAELETKMRVYDISKNIDKRRKWLYAAYSSLLLNLPFLFYSYGRFNTSYNAYFNAYGDVDYEELLHYRKLSLIGIGLVSASGAWMLAELVAYLIAVDKTLPPKAKKIRSRTLKKMEMERELEEQRLLEEAETDVEVETESDAGAETETEAEEKKEQEEK